MITMEMIGKVRRMKMREKLTISEIAKRTGLARNTVKRWNINTLRQASCVRKNSSLVWFKVSQPVELCISVS